MKILAIGNSFSQDATRYLQKIGESTGTDLFVRNAYIGGCSLEMHANNAKSEEKVYEYQKDADKIEDISLTGAIPKEKWDFITVQQASHFSGKYETYEPYLSELIAHIKQHAPQAKIVFHRTWPYEKGSTHGAFPDYGCDRTLMYEKIVGASAVAAERYGLDIIPAGDIIYALGQTDYFDKENGGVSLYRDGFHLGWIYGRYLAALVWYKFFTGNDVSAVTYIPKEAEKEIIEILKKSL